MPVCSLSALIPNLYEFISQGHRDANRLPLIIGRLEPLNLSLITLQRTLSSIVDGSLRVCAVRMSHADVKRMCGGANIFVRRTCARTVKYTHRLITPAIFSFAREALMKHAARESWRNHKIYQRALIVTHTKSLCVSHEGAEYPKYEQHDVLDFQCISKQWEKEYSNRCTWRTDIFLTIKKNCQLLWLSTSASRRKEKFFKSIFFYIKIHSKLKRIRIVTNDPDLLITMFVKSVHFIFFRAIKAWPDVVENAIETESLYASRALMTNTASAADSRLFQQKCIMHRQRRRLTRRKI